MNRVKYRSVPNQAYPYRKFSVVEKSQTEFELFDVDGWLVGFWFPESAGGYQPVGFHLHFVTADFKTGGHILEVDVKEATVQIQSANHLVIIS